MQQFVVIMPGPMEGQIVYGPFTEEEEAAQFSQFLHQEVDPSRVVPLMSPVKELLAWRRSVREGMI